MFFPTTQHYGQPLHRLPPTICTVWMARRPFPFFSRQQPVFLMGQLAADLEVRK